jgi:hypothetical protein
MLTFLRALPLILVLGAGGYAGHWLIVLQKNNEIAILTEKLESLSKENAALELAEQEQALTIQDLEDESKRQASDISRLSNRNQIISKERDEYLSIFRRHDLTNLSRAKPGLIEPRINQGTTDIFKQIEQDTSILYEKNIDPYTNFIFPNP